MSEAIDRLRAALGDRYEIERELGEGGMATVYLARDVKHERNVALKVLRPELAATLGTDRFLQEVRVTANLQHPHILPLFDSGEADGFLYYVMPYLEGESLRERVEREGELPVGEAVKILREVVDALATAHQMGVVHRDIKPDNVMLSGRHAVVTDFGVAKAVSEATGRHNLTTKGVALGTPAYMAPEQAAANEHIDHRADIYAVGAMGYELLAGRPPFTGMTAQQVLAAHVTQVPKQVTELRETVPDSLGLVLMRCLEKKPADRWQNAEELLGQLEVFATPTTGLTPTQMLPTKSTTGTPMWMKVVAPVALVAILLFLWIGGREPAVDVAADDAAAATVPAAEFTFAVAPFENQSGVDSLNAFGTIMADYLSGQIRRNDIAPVAPAAVVRDLVAAREAGTNMVSYLAEETGTQYVITGTYYTEGGSLVMQAEIVPANGSESVSVDPVDAPLTSLREAAQAGAEVLLGVTARIVDPDQPPATVAGQPRSYAAYRLFVEAVEAQFQLDRQRALELLDRAVEEDSTFAEAYIVAAVVEWNHRGLSFAVDSLVQLAARFRSDLGPWEAAQLDWIEGYVRGDRAGVVRASLELDRLGNPISYVCRDARMTNQLDIARPSCVASLEDDDRAAAPASFAFTWVDYLNVLHLAGDHEVELAQAQRMRGLFPDRRAGVTREIRALAALGRMDEASAMLDTLRERQNEEDWGLGPSMRVAAAYLLAYGHEELGAEANAEAIRWHEEQDPDSENHAAALYQGGDVSGAMEIFEGLVAETPDDEDVVGWTGMAAARLGDTARVVEIDRRLQVLETRPYKLGSATQWRATIAAESGELDRAVDLMRQAHAEGRSFGAYLRTSSLFANLQGHPAFEAWMAPRN